MERLLGGVGEAIGDDLVGLYLGGSLGLGGFDPASSDVDVLVDIDPEIVTDLSISDGVAHVTWMANGPNDGACCPTVKMVADLRWDGSTVVAQNVRRAD